MIEEHKFKYFKKGWLDRYDGWRVRKVDPAMSVVPYFLRTRMDSQNFFEETINIDHIEEFIKLHKEDIPNLSIMHVVMAAMVRLISQRPYLNRFVIWNKLFARNHMSFSIAVKRTLSDDGEETLIKPYFQPEDTLQDVVNKVVHEQMTNQQVGQKNSSDIISRILGVMPDSLIRFVVFTLLHLDKVGFMPKFVNQASPWHCSLFLTNIGSIGVGSIYHHLYEFGTCSLFLAMGKKSRNHSMDKEGNLKAHKSIQLKFVLDERICDGFYYASSMRLLSKILMDPAILLTSPEQVVIDECVGKKHIDI